MTVPLDNYTATVANINAAQAYPFTWPYSDDDAVEVFEILDTGARYQTPPQDYYIENTTNPRAPTKEGGRIVFTRPHASNIVRVSVERNTLITQLADFSFHDDFNTRMLEYVLDKATMILQEIDDRKCDSVAADITQKLIFGSYFAFTAGQIDSALDKLYAIALEIKGSASDCRGDPDNT